MAEEKKRVGTGIGVMVVKKEKVLLGQTIVGEKSSSYVEHEKNTWTLPGGRLEYGETFEEVARRELKEETGLLLKKGKVFCVNNEKSPETHCITIGFLAMEIEGEPKVMEPDNISEWKWFELNKIPNELYEPTRKLLQCYLQKKFCLENPEEQKR